MLRDLQALLPPPLRSIDPRLLFGVVVAVIALFGTLLMGPLLFSLRILAFAYVTYASFFALAHSQLSQHEHTRKLGLLLYALLLLYLVKMLL